MTKRAALWNAVATLAAVLLLFLFVDPAGRAPDWARFMARQHPAIVHLPIGFLVFAGLLAAFRRWRKADDPGPTEQAALVLGGWGAIAAAAAGSWLIQMGGYPTDVLFWHRVLGFVIPLAAAGTLLASMHTPVRGLRGATWTLLIGSLAVGGHLGGEMTHGKAFTAEYAPGVLKPLIGEAPSLATRFDLSRPDSVTVFDAIVVPILRAKCTSCHGEGRSKGGLDLTTSDAIAAHETDSEDDPLITWGDAEASLFIQRVMLPAEHRRAMPPIPDAKPLSHADVELLRWWVDSEAGFDGTITSVEIPPSIDRLLQLYGMEELASGVFALDVPEADTSLISGFRATGATLFRVAADQPFLDLACASADCLTVPALEGLQDQIMSIDLSGSDMSDESLAALSVFPHLSSLDLSRTAVTGATLDALTGHQYLTRLNLYGTRVADAALDQLADFPALESVYLWNSSVTEEGVARLRDALPNAEINFGE